MRRAMRTREWINSDSSSRCRREVGRRDQHAEALAPDHHARVALEVDAGGNRVALAALEGTQAAEIDIHQIFHVGGAADGRLRYEQHMEGRPGSDLEIGFEEDGALVDAHLAASPM